MLRSSPEVARARFRCGRDAFIDQLQSNNMGYKVINARLSFQHIYSSKWNKV
jgi:hypothetical protein